MGGLLPGYMGLAEELIETAGALSIGTFALVTVVFFGGWGSGQLLRGIGIKLLIKETLEEAM